MRLLSEVETRRSGSLPFVYCIFVNLRCNVFSSQYYRFTESVMFYLNAINFFCSEIRSKFQAFADQAIRHRSPEAQRNCYGLCMLQFLSLLLVFASKIDRIN